MIRGAPGAHIDEPLAPVEGRLTTQPTPATWSATGPGPDSTPVTSWQGPVARMQREYLQQVGTEKPSVDWPG